MCIRDSYYSPTAALAEPPSDPTLQKQIHELTVQVEQLQQDQAMPAVVLNRYRNSIGYIYGVYQVSFANQRPVVRARVSGTGFLVGRGLIATNRHVAEPWYGDSEAERLIDRGATAMLENLVVFFPGSPMPVKMCIRDRPLANSCVPFFAAGAPILRFLQWRAAMLPVLFDLL